MKKSLIALAIAGVIAAPAAMAEGITIYGQANASVDFVSSGSGSTAANGAGTGTSSYNNNQISSNQSRLGFKGAEDLGDGLSAIWQLETSFNLDSSLNGASTSSALGNRDTFVGLSSGNLGTVILGTHDTPYKMATRGFDLFADGIADNRTLMGGVGMATANAAATLGAPATLSGVAAKAATATLNTNETSSIASFDGRQGNVFAYIAPAFSGLTLAIAYVPLNEFSSSAVNNGKRTAWSFAALYGAGPLNVNFGYESHDLGDVIATNPSNSVKENAWKIGAGYTFDAFTVNAVYEKTSDTVGSLLVPAASDNNYFGHSAYYLGGKYAVSSVDAVKLAYSHAGQLNYAGNPANQSNTGANLWSLGYDHDLSKHTTIYALYAKLNNQSAANYTLGGYSSATTGGTLASGYGASPSAFSLGLKHSF